MILFGSAAVREVPRQAQELQRAALGCSVRGDKRRQQTLLSRPRRTDRGQARALQAPHNFPGANSTQRPVQLQLQLSFYSEYIWFFFLFWRQQIRADSPTKRKVEH